MGEGENGSAGTGVQPTPILHHYATSLFSEKVRLALGLRALDWRSVDISPVMPRPDLMPLTGGYRRTPVLQHGADIYCDTQCILPFLDSLASPGAKLFPYSGLEWPMARWADTAFFQAAVGVVFGSLPDGVISEEFQKDREQLSGRPFDLEAMRQHAPHALTQWRGGARWVEDVLSRRGADGEGWLLGEQPSAADLAVYIVFWFTAGIATMGGRAPEVGPATASWMERVAAIGHGAHTALDSSKALQEAAACSPSRVSEEVVTPGFEVGDEVAVMPDDYGCIPVSGRLLCATDRELVLAREDATAGAITVHFPRVGFVLSPT